MENRGTKDASEAMRHAGAQPRSCHLGSRGSSRETSARSTVAAAFRKGLGARAYVAELYELGESGHQGRERGNAARGCATTLLSLGQSFIYGGLRAVVSGTMYIGEMVRHKGTPQSSSHGFCGPLPWGRPCGVFWHRASADGCGAPRTNEAGQPLGARHGTLVTWIFRAIVGGYPLRVGTMLAFRGT